MKIAAFALILLAVFNLNNAIALTGSNLTIENMWHGFSCVFSSCGNSESNNNQAVNEATINIQNTGYSPNYLTIKAGTTVSLHVVNTGGAGCTQAFTIPQLGIQRVVPIGTSDTITFTAPSQPGNLAFMCSMGMYRGMMNVI